MAGSQANLLSKCLDDLKKKKHEKRINKVKSYLSNGGMRSFAGEAGPFPGKIMQTLCLLLDHVYDQNKRVGTVPSSRLT